MTSMASEAQEFVQETSIYLTQKPNTEEGADFPLEEVNQQIQPWLQNIPSANEWKISCCNYAELSELPQKLFTQMEVKGPKLGR